MKKIFLSLLITLLLGACLSVKHRAPGEPADAAAMTMNPKDSVIKTQNPGLSWLDMESGYEKARKEGKILMIDMYTDWCGWCKVMDRKTFSNDTIKNYLKKYFVTVKMNPEKAHTFILGKDTFDQSQLHSWLGYGRTFGYPTIYFWLKPGESEERYAAIGFNESWDFISILEQVQKKAVKK